MSSPDTKSSDQRSFGAIGARVPIAAATAAHRDPLFPVAPEELLVVDQIALPLEQHVQAPMAETTPFLGDCPHALEGRLGQPGPSGIKWSCGSSRWLYTPAVRSSRRRLGDGRQLSAWPRASRFLFHEVLQGRLSSMVSAKSRFSRVFSSSRVFSRLGSDTSNSTELRLPFVDAGVADAVLAAQIGDRHAGLMLVQNSDDLLFPKKRLRFMLWSLSWARTKFKSD